MGSDQDDRRFPQYIQAHRLMRVPDLVKGYAVSILSLFAGAAVVHEIYKPDLTLPLNQQKDSPKKG